MLCMGEGTLLYRLKHDWIDHRNSWFVFMGNVYSTWHRLNYNILLHCSSYHCESWQIFVINQCIVLLAMCETGHSVARLGNYWVPEMAQKVWNHWYFTLCLGIIYFARLSADKVYTVICRIFKSGWQKEKQLWWKNFLLYLWVPMFDFRFLVSTKGKQLAVVINSKLFTSGRLALQLTSEKIVFVPTAVQYFIIKSVALSVLPAIWYVTDKTYSNIWTQLPFHFLS